MLVIAGLFAHFLCLSALLSHAKSPIFLLSYCPMYLLLYNGSRKFVLFHPTAKYILTVSTTIKSWHQAASIISLAAGNYCDIHNWREESVNIRLHDTNLWISLKLDVVVTQMALHPELPNRSRVVISDFWLISIVPYTYGINSYIKHPCLLPWGATCPTHSHVISTSITPDVVRQFKSISHRKCCQFITD